MKKPIVICISLIFTYSLFAGQTFAISPTPIKSGPTPTTAATTKASPTPTGEPVNNQINQLKDRIASRVAELKLVERRGIIGTATDISGTHLTITDVQNNTRFVDVDELTKFSSPSAKGSFGISDITKGSKLGIIGLYNKQSRRLLARFVDVISYPQTYYGAVASVDNENFTITVALENNGRITADIENTTRTSTYTKSGGIVRSGFSKLQAGERIMVVGFPDSKEKNRVTAGRILVFPELPRNQKINVTLNQEAPVTSTGSGKKLTPLKPIN